MSSLDLIGIYEGFSESTRRRILHLLWEGPLCVCHFQKALNEPQVKISKHLSYLRERGLVEGSREQNWVVYQLPQKRSRQLDAHLKCLMECASEDAVFIQDKKRLAKVLAAVVPSGRLPAAMCRG